MTLATIVVLGFFLGMSHALEADHIAAVASLSTSSRSLGEGVRMGVAWGVGHTLTLFLFGSIVLLLHEVVPANLSSGLELAVGVMLVVLGIDVWRRLVRDRIHVHVHRHTDGTTHFHAHSHRQADQGTEGERESKARSHDRDPHDHRHGRLLPGRALIVGLVHGMAGSAALVLLALEKAPSVVAGLAYILVFGVGSILGMAVLSAAISVPLRWSAKGLTRFHHVLEVGVGALTIGVGLSIIHGHLGVLFPR